MKKYIVVSLIISLLVSLVALPLDTEAKTVAEFEKEVKKYTKQLEETQANLAKNEAEVTAIEAKIKTYEKQIKEAEEETEKLQEEIDESNEEISRKSEESKKILEYYQISNGENIYLEYAFGATSITDMIYRMSIVEQLTDYNDKLMKELEALIEKNKAQQKSLAEKKANLLKLNEDLEREKAKIQADSASLRETVPSIEMQISEAKSMLAYYKGLGCGDNEDIQACQFRISSANTPNVSFFSRPMQSGYVVRGFNSSHNGYDLSNYYNKSEPIYPIADGIVHAIYTDNCASSNWCQNQGFWCNGNAKIVVIRHNYNNSYIYSLYAHVGSYGNIREGQFVTRNTVIAYMGTTGCSTGPHLHLEVASCFWKNNGGCTYNGYLNKLINPKKLIAFPYNWSNR